MSSLAARAWALVVPPFCWDCGADARMGEPLCASCRSALRWLGPEVVTVNGVEVWAPVAYEGPGRALVRGLKYRGAAGLAEPMAAAICAGAPALDGALVPVPLHARRRRQRGFNQAERVAPRSRAGRGSRWPTAWSAAAPRRRARWAAIAPSASPGPAWRCR